MTTTILKKTSPMKRISFRCPPCSICTKTMEDSEPNLSLSQMRILLHQVALKKRLRKSQPKTHLILRAVLSRVKNSNQAPHRTQVVWPYRKRKNLRSLKSKPRSAPHLHLNLQTVMKMRGTRKAGFLTYQEPNRKATLSLRMIIAARKMASSSTRIESTASLRLK